MILRKVCRRGSTARVRSRRAWSFAAVALLAACSGGGSPFLTSSSAPSQTLAAQATGAPQETVLYRFAERGTNDAAGPLTGVIFGANGRLYGTSVFGGTTENGTFFEIAFNGKGGARERVLHSFGVGSDGAKPGAGLTADATGAFYTDTVVGGAAGGGTVVKLTPSGSGYDERVIYNFTGGFNGSQPIGSLVLDTSGAIYGATQFGGSTGAGIIFKLTPSGSRYTESVAYDFPAGGAGGYLPQAGLTAGRAGNIYGTTYYGGLMSLCNTAGCGVVFKLTSGSQGLRETVIHAFAAGPDGANPFGELAIDEHTGSVYGTTTWGGRRHCNGATGCGIMFRLTPAGSAYAETVLLALSLKKNGAFPEDRPLLGKHGVVYGTASVGGTACPQGCGTAFKLIPSGNQYAFSMLHDFTGGKDGADPEQSGLITDSSGALYGTTRSGGGRHCSDGGPGGTRGCGVLYKIVLPFSLK